MYEKYNVNSFYLLNEAVGVAYANGKKTAVIVDSGNVTHITPIYEGYCLPHAIQRLKLGGKDLNQYLHNLLAERGYTLFILTHSEREIINDIKQKYCYVAQDYKKK